MSAASGSSSWSAWARTLGAQLTLGLGAVALITAVVGLAVSRTHQPGPAFALSFGVVLPLCLLAGARIAACTQGPRADLLVALPTAGVLAVILVARLVSALGGAASPVLLGGTILWGLGVAATYSYPRDWRPGPPREDAPTPWAWAAGATVGALAVLGALGLSPAHVLHAGPLLASLLGAGALLVAFAAARRVRVAPRLGRAADALAIGVIVLLVIDVLIYTQLLPFEPHAVIRQPPSSFTPTIQLFALSVHHDFYLAPVNEVLHGGTVLVDVYSQYGVGVLYALAAWFKVAPLGYGALGLLVGALTALQYALAYAILRLAGCRRALAAVAAAVALAATVFGALGSVAHFPSTVALRFGWCYALVVIAVASARWPRRDRALRVARLLIVAISAVWSLEVLVYVLVTFAAISATEAAMRDGSWQQRSRRLGRDLVEAGAVCGSALVALTLMTAAVAGTWPDWRPYLAFFGVYSGQRVGILRLPLVRAWSPGLGLGALYFTSVLALVGLLRQRMWEERQRAWLVAVAACTAFGVVTLTYWVGDPNPNDVTVIAVPAIMVGTLWLSMLDVAGSGSPRAIRLGGQAVGAWLAALLTVTAWAGVAHKIDRTALAQALRGPRVLIGDLRRVWRSPRIDPREGEAQTLLARYAPSRAPVGVLLEPDLTVETLLHTRRVNALPLGDILQDDLVRRYTLPRVARTVTRLAPGSLLLAQLRPDPQSSPLEQPTPLQAATLALIRRRFKLQVLETSPSGLSMIRLVPHSPGAASM